MYPCIALQFYSTERGSGVGGEERIACTGSTDMTCPLKSGDGIPFVVELTDWLHMRMAVEYSRLFLSSQEQHLVQGY